MPITWIPPAGLAAASSTPQLIMAVVWGTMGAGCMLFPEPLMRMSFAKDTLPEREGETNPALKLTFRCFGAQAVMVGLLLGVSKLDRRGHALWGLAILPFFAFDAMAYNGGLLTPLGAIGDAIGNTVFLAASAAGAGWLRIADKSN
jgi:hypothetical protein